MTEFARKLALWIGTGLGALVLLMGSFFIGRAAGPKQGIPPEKLRKNPTVLKVAEMQADFVWAKMLANDLREGPDGQLLIGVRSGKGEVEYLPLDPDKLKDKRLAWTIYPRRMVIVQGSFPYMAQIEEIQKALRLENPIDAFDVYKPEETARFRGVLVQRQILLPDGTVETPWADVDLVSNYMRTIYPRKYGDQTEDANTQYVLLHSGHRLVMPLPILLGGKYADIRMGTIKESVRKQLALNKPPAELAGLPEHVLIRFIDDDIVPGHLYQYRMKVLMQNPNWWGPLDKNGQPTNKFKKDLVARASEVEIMLLGADEGDKAAIKNRFGLDGDDLRRNLAARTDWKELDAKLSVPREDYLFATDPPVDGKGKPTIALKPGQGVLQIQRWLPVVSVDHYKEPVADWVVADVLAKRGAYLGCRQLVNLPLWSSKINKYVLRRGVEPEKGKPRSGIFMDPTRPGPQYAVVDVQGGFVELKRFIDAKISPGFQVTIDHTATEILLLDENGALQVRSSYADRADTGRADREKAWKDWIDKTERDPQSLPVEPKAPDPKVKIKEPK